MSTSSASDMTTASHDSRKSEQSIACARASVMIYDDVNKKWVPSGTSSGLSKVHIFEHQIQHTFRVVGRKLQDQEVVINCAILKGLKYNQATPTFHQWRDSKQVYGLNFRSREDADAFASAMYHSLQVLSNMQNNRAPPQQNNQMNMNNQNGVVHCDEDMGYRTMTREDVAIIQEKRSSITSQNSLLQQPHSPQSPAAPIIANSGHHRASSAPPAPNPPPLTLMQPPIPPPMQQTPPPPLPPSNHGPPSTIHININNNYNSQQNQQLQMSSQQQQYASAVVPPAPPPHGINYNHQTTVVAPTNVNNVNFCPPRNGNVPPPPPPHAPGANIPPPPPPPSNNISRSSSQDGSDSNSLAAQLQNARLKRNKQNGGGNAIENGSAAVANNNSNYGTIGRGTSGGGMASMMDEMAKTLARRRAAVENKKDTSNMDLSDVDSESAKKSTWEKTNTLPNNAKICDQSPKSIRKRFGSASEETILKVNGLSTDNLNLSTMTLTATDLEVFKVEIMKEFRKELVKFKQEIVDAVKSEWNRR